MQCGRCGVTPPPSLVDLLRLNPSTSTVTRSGSLFQNSSLYAKRTDILACFSLKRFEGSDFTVIWPLSNRASCGGAIRRMRASAAGAASSGAPLLAEYRRERVHDYRREGGRTGGSTRGREYRYEMEGGRTGGMEVVQEVRAAANIYDHFNLRELDL